MCGSTCFRCFLAHHQERTTALGGSGFTVGAWWKQGCCIGGSGFTVGAWWKQRCWSWSGKSARPQPTTLLPPRTNGKTRAPQCSCMVLMMGEETSETCWATHKRQVINLWNCCILLVNLFESYDDGAWTYERQMYLTCLSQKCALLQRSLHSDCRWLQWLMTLCVISNVLVIRWVGMVYNTRNVKLWIHTV